MSVATLTVFSNARYLPARRSRECDHVTRRQPEARSLPAGRPYSILRRWPALHRRPSPSRLPLPEAPGERGDGEPGRGQLGSEERSRDGTRTHSGAGARAGEKVRTSGWAMPPDARKASPDDEAFLSRNRKHRTQAQAPCRITGSVPRAALGSPGGCSTGWPKRRRRLAPPDR